MLVNKMMGKRSKQYAYIRANYYTRVSLIFQNKNNNNKKNSKIAHKIL